jgi:WD40 repeat protein
VTTRLAFWLPVLGFALALAIASSSQPLAGANDPKDTPKETEAKLPKGAKLRLNDTPIISGFAPEFIPQPPDFKTLVMLHGHETLCRYDLITHKPLDKDAEKGLLHGFSGGLVLSGDGKRFVSVHPGILTVRETATGKEIKQVMQPSGFRPASGINQTVSLSANGKILAQGGTGAGDKGGILVWDVDKSEAIFQIGGFFNGAALPVISPDGKLVAVRAMNAGFRQPGAKQEDDPAGTVWVYEVDGGKELLKAQMTSGGFQRMTAVVFSPDNSTVATSFGDGIIDLFDLKTGKAKPLILGRAGQGMHLTFSEDSKTLASVGTDGTIQRWNLADGKSIDVTEAPVLLLGQPQGIAFAGNRLIAWGATGGCPLVWEAPSGKLLTQLPEHTQAIKSIAFANKGKEIITSGLDGRVVRWDAKTGKPIGEVKLKPSRATRTNLGGISLITSLTPDGTKAVTNTGPGAVIDLATGLEEFSLPRGPRNLSSTHIQSADATKIMVLSNFFSPGKPAKFSVWDLSTRQKLLDGELTGAVGHVPSFAVSPSGKRLVIAGYKQSQVGAAQTFSVTGWDLETGKKLSEVEDMVTKGAPVVAAVSDSFAVVGSSMGRIRAYDYEAGRGGDEFAALTGAVEPTAPPIAVIADGKQFASTGRSKEPGLYDVKIHEWPTGKVLHTFTGHRAPITAMTLSPDGKTLATGSQDATVLLWDLYEVK